ncbi:lytic transglycosylase domain-containing protein [Rhizobium grahamii]|uniref:Type IV system transglycosylase n=1 Tax=Rhizobium grahamii CCGE 502 TaxID=990285 RepID=S3HEB7_9HYPH|nr:lytic transglycosylase domain-containing protein [Rhizobium grahamii]EPE97074.1 type IV system transglycosylase [Rhizobium grahamii CCGE 502]
MSASPASRSPLAVITFAAAGFVAAPDVAKADVPTVDRSALGLRQHRERVTGDLEEIEQNRHIINSSVTCSMYRPARRNDPVGAAEANPEIVGLVRRIAREEDVDENQFLALVYQESRFNPCARSAAGATGLAQLMPETAAALGVDINNIEENLRGGARYYRNQLQSFGGNVNLALAAYNSGPGNVSKYGGIPPFKETQGYVALITKAWLPAFGGSDKTAIPLNFGGGETAFTNMRSSTLLAMGMTASTSASLGDVASWYKQLGATTPGTVQESFDHNSVARNANLEMMNNVIKLTTAMAELINSRNAVSSASLSGSSRSSSTDRIRQSHDTIQLCDPRQDLFWSDEAKACVEKRSDGKQVQLMLHPQ